MAYTEYKQRRALGARYGRSPELELDKLRLQEEYRLMPERARLAELKRQSLLADKRREEALDAAETQGMIKSVGNLAKTGMQLYSKSGSTIIGDTAKNIGGWALGKLGVGTGEAAGGVAAEGAAQGSTVIGDMAKNIGDTAKNIGGWALGKLGVGTGEAAGGAAALGAGEAAAAGVTAAGKAGAAGATAAAEGAAQGTAAVVGEAIGSAIPWVGVALAADMVDKFFTRAVIDKNT
jgi:hypothetical protein